MLHNKKIDLLWKTIRGLFLSYFEALKRLQRREIIAVINLVPAVQRSIITGINVTIYLGGFSQIRKKSITPVRVTMLKNKAEWRRLPAA
jgi:hypothetical protein